MTHVIVAIHAGPGSFTSTRLVRNIAGANADFLPRSKPGSALGELLHQEGDLVSDAFLLHKIIVEAQATVEFEDKMIVVADRIED